MQKICENCQKTYKQKTANGQERFCSRLCYGQYRAEHPNEYAKRTGIEHHCERCNKTVYRKPSEVREHIFCSRQCSNQFQSAYFKQHPELTAAGGISITCHQCGKSFRVKAHRATRAKYCSQICSWSARFGVAIPHTTPDYSGENNPNYKGGKNRVTARKNGIKTYGKQCMICGYDLSVDVHHITPKREGGKNDSGNIIVLCPNHHAMADKGIISREELFKTTRAASSR